MRPALKPRPAAPASGILLIVTLSTAPFAAGVATTSEKRPLPRTSVVTWSLTKLVARMFGAPLVWKVKSNCTGRGSAIRTLAAGSSSPSMLVT